MATGVSVQQSLTDSVISSSGFCLVSSSAFTRPALFTTENSVFLFSASGQFSSVGGSTQAGRPGPPGPPGPPGRPGKPDAAAPRLTLCRICLTNIQNDLPVITDSVKNHFQQGIQDKDLQDLLGLQASQASILLNTVL